ncbi:MAG: hypothetical protein ACR2LL_11715 [Nitrosopumilus sp.]
METKIILGLEEQAAETAKEVLRLSDSETNKIEHSTQDMRYSLPKITGFMQSLR